MSYGSIGDGITSIVRILFWTSVVSVPLERMVIRKASIRDGIERRKAKGLPIGRPKKRDDNKIKKLLNMGWSIRKIAKKLGYSNSSVEACRRNHQPPEKE